MMSGLRPFSRASPDQTMQAILDDEPAPFAASVGVPIELERLVWCCLSKEPAQRFQSAGDLARALESFAAGRALRKRRLASWSLSDATFRHIAWGFAIVLIAIVSGVAGRALYPRPRPVIGAATFELPPPTGTTFASAPMVSPDGASIAFAADGPDGRFIWVRRLATLTVRRVEGTGGAMQPFWSPDGQSLGFFAGGKLRKVALSRGPSVSLAEASMPPE